MNPNDQDDLKKLKGNAWIKGNLPFGCQLCTKGMKVVYFMGGDCNHPNHCLWYCPISDHRRRKDAHYVDEIPVENPADIENIISTLNREIRAVDAQGMSLTGGDPLSNSNKVTLACSIIQAMKIEYGQDFHIHLYTSGKNFDPTIADKLEASGLDSLRFHPGQEDFHKIEYALDHTFTVGAEVPVIPTEENQHYILDLIQYLDAIGADYINLNEFEMCAPNQTALLERGFTLEEGTMATVKGSRQFAERILREVSPRTNLAVHFCSVAVKDQVQIQARYLRRAEKIRFEYEDISEDGCLLFMRVQGPLQEVTGLWEYLVYTAEVPEKAMNLNRSKGMLDLPPFLAEEEGFIDLLSDYRVKCGIYEVLPFRDPKLAEVREYTPLMDNLPRHS
ncbi:MAG: hypothetical protein ACTSVZ_12430 [Promethearchaeota archaeon]